MDIKDKKIFEMFGIIDIIKKCACKNNVYCNKQIKYKIINEKVHVIQYLYVVFNNEAFYYNPYYKYEDYVDYKRNNENNENNENNR